MSILPEQQLADRLHPGFRLVSGVFAEVRGEKRGLVLLFEKPNAPGKNKQQPVPPTKVHMVHCSSVPKSCVQTVAAWLAAPRAKYQ